MNIKREFLYNEEKILPIQLLRTNYGVSDANPTSTSNISSSLTPSNSLDITFPQGSSNVAVLIDTNTDKVVDVKATQPGESIITLSIHPDKTYNIYIISREYTDGYINDMYRVSDPISANRAEISTNNTPPAIHLEEDGAMVISKGRNEDEWYGYSDYYRGETLIWDSPRATDGTGGKYTYLIYVKDVIGDMLNCFDVEFGAGGMNTTDYSFDNSIRTIAGHDNLVKYIRKLESNSQLLGIPQIGEILTFIKSPQNLKPLYVTDTNEIHDILEGCVALAVFGGLEDDTLWGSPTTRQKLLSVDTHSEEVYYEPYDSYVNGTVARTGDESRLSTYKRRYSEASKVYGECEQAFGLGVAEAAGWDAAAGTGGDTVRHILATTLAQKMDGKKSTFNTTLTNMGWSTTLGYGGTSKTLIENDIESFASHLKENVYSWLLAKKEEIDSEISIAGDSIFYGLHRETITGITTAYTSTTTYVNVGNGNLASTSMPSWFDITVPYTDYSSGGDLIDSGSFSPSWIWDKLVNGFTGSVTLYPAIGNPVATPFQYQRILPTSKSNYLPSFRPDLDGPDGGIGGWRQTTVNGRKYKRESNWGPVYESISSHLNDLYPPITSAVTNQFVTTAITSTTILVTGDTSGSYSGGQFQVGHEATLQNIRYIKNLINSMDENLWASYTNTNSLILSSLVQLQNNMEAEPAKSTITNITSSFVRNGAIEILWKKSTDDEWSTDGITIENLDNDVKLLNLDVLDTVGKYFVLVRPVKNVGSIVDVVGQVIVADELNEDTPNYYYGYNAQILKDDGTPVEIGTRVVVESYRESVGKQYLKLSPVIQSIEAYGTNHKIEIWSNEFIPVLIEVDVVEHNALTLSYSMYAKKEMDLDTGLCTIYDYTGNPYKTLSFGKYSNAATSRHIIEYRIPAEDENKP